MARQLPVFLIAETGFYVDIDREELRQVTDPSNTIPFSEMNYEFYRYWFHYSPHGKNLPSNWHEEQLIISMPPLIDLDPVGMCLKYGLPLEELKGKTDAMLIVDQDQLDERINGILPIIKIHGHPFYVDMQMGFLRPHKDFTTEGLPIHDDSDYLHQGNGKLWAPYHPASHSIQTVEIDKILTVPSDIHIIELPAVKDMDPVGFARRYDIDLTHFTRFHPPRQHMVARNVSWEEFGLPAIISANKLRLKNARSRKRLFREDSGKGMKKTP